MGGGGGEDEDSYSYADLGGHFLGHFLGGFFFSCCARGLVVCLFWDMVVDAVAVVIFQLYLGVTGRVANVGLIVVASGSVAE